jgi:hypothetical protein
LPAILAEGMAAGLRDAAWWMCSLKAPASAGLAACSISAYATSITTRCDAPPPRPYLHLALPPLVLHLSALLGGHAGVVAPSAHHAAACEVPAEAWVQQPQPLQPRTPTPTEPGALAAACSDGAEQCGTLIAAYTQACMLVPLRLLLLLLHQGLPCSALPCHIHGVLPRQAVHDA